MELIRYAKYHALGNAYTLLEIATPPTKDQIRLLCHPQYGLGGDGLLIGRTVGDGQFALRIFNPDGSEAEKSGNGLRIYARYLADEGQAGQEPIVIETRGGAVLATIDQERDDVGIDMGRVNFYSEDIPVAGPSREVIQERLHFGGVELVYSAASIGNPHCVIRVKKLDEQFTRRFGPLIENNPLFPNRTNVQFLEVIDRDSIAIQIWERGAGYTLSSGSSSCAAAAVAVRLGLCQPEVTVHQPGGPLAVTITREFHAILRGPVQFVSRGLVAIPD